MCNSCATTATTSNRTKTKRAPAHHGCLAGTGVPFTLDSHNLPNWGYEGEGIYGHEPGPANWGDLCEEYSIAKTGVEQSPINIITSECQPASTLGKLQYENREDHHAEIVNNGHTVQVGWQGGSVRFPEAVGCEFVMKSFHFHSPSEHTINGKHFDLEMHVVHVCESTGQIAVVAVLFNEDRAPGGEPNPFLAQFFNKSELPVMPRDLDSLEDPHLCEVKVEQTKHLIDLHHTRDGGNDLMHMGSTASAPASSIGGGYFRYMGSLTTPPCTEKVIWTISDRVARVTPEELEQFRGAIHVQCSPSSGHEACCGNIRPVQPLNGRQVQHFFNEAEH